LGENCTVSWTFVKMPKVIIGQK